MRGCSQTHSVAPTRRSQRLLDMGQSPRRTSAHISPTSPQAQNPGGILDSQAMDQVLRRGPAQSPPRNSRDQGVIHENQGNMEAGPSRPAPPNFPPPVVEDDVSSTNSQHAPARGHNPVEPSLTRCTPQLLNALDSLLDYREKQRAHMESRPVPARQFPHDGTHHPERCHNPKVTAPLQQPRPSAPARSRPRPHEDIHGDSLLISEKSLPPPRRRRVQEEPPVCV